MRLKSLLILLVEEFGIVDPIEFVELRSLGDEKWAIVRWPIGVDKRAADRRLETKYKLVPDPPSMFNFGPYTTAYRIR